MSRNRQKIPVGGDEYAELPTQQQTPLTNEVASRARSWMNVNGMYLPNPDPVLKKQGRDISIYRELRADAHVKADIIKRKAGVLSLEWEIHQGEASQQHQDLIEATFKRLPMHAIISEMLEAALFGYQPLEIIWTRQSGQVVPSQVVAKPPEWFLFSTTNELLFRSSSAPNGEALPPRKFLLAQNDATYDNPYGDPALSGCFWPVVFKRGGMKFWVTFSEKYGMPFLVGKYSRGTQQRDIDALLDSLEEMIQDAVAAIPEDASVDIIEAAGKTGSSDVFKTLLEFLNAEISKSIVGQTLTTEITGNGSYAASQTHGNVLSDIVDSDARMIESVFNQLIRWIIEINHGNVSELPTFRLYEEEDVDQQLAERDQKLSATGIKFTEKYYQRAYGFQDGDIEITPPGNSPGMPSFTETRKALFADQDALDSMIESFEESPETLQAQAEQLLKPIIGLINGAGSYEEVLGKLAETYPDMPTRGLEQTLSRALFVSDVWGRLSAQQENDNDNE